MQVFLSDVKWWFREQKSLDMFDYRGNRKGKDHPRSDVCSLYVPGSIIAHSMHINLNLHEPMNFAPFWHGKMFNF